MLSRSLISGEGGRASLEGYEERSFEVPRRFNMWVIGNVVTLFLGMYVDIFTGAFFTYTEEYEFQMYPDDGQD